MFADVFNIQNKVKLHLTFDSSSVWRNVDTPEILVGDLLVPSKLRPNKVLRSQNTGLLVVPKIHKSTLTVL